MTLTQDATRLHHAGRIAEAVQLYRQVLQTSPKDIAALYGLGMAFAQTGRLDEGERILADALKINARFTEGWRARGLMLMHLGRRKEALTCLDSALALDPEQADIWNSRGSILAATARREEALASFERAVTIKPDYIEALCNRATALFEMQRFDAALAAFDTLLGIEPQLAVGWNNRGNTLTKMQRFEEAVASYDRALGLKPDFAEAKENRDFALFALRRTPRSPAKYMRGLFDGFAPHYDDTMLAKLDYRAHLHVRALATRVLAHLTPPWRILDLGCGTGLVGTVFKEFAAGGCLDGIDIAPLMLDAVRARGLYDDLILGDLETVLAQSGAAYDVIVSADTITYFGELAPVLAGMEARLAPGGFALFTSEAKPGEGWEQTKVHRYRHSEAYLRAEAARAGFECVDIMECTLRREENAPVAGFAVGLRKLRKPKPQLH